MLKFYVRSFTGDIVEVNKLDFDIVLDKLRNGNPDLKYEVYTGFGIQVSKWSYQGMLLCEEKEYFEAWEEVYNE